ncbi:MAG: hypothetical protein LBK67_01395, partial [Coriobacteriales bacterium]|nr:hypothetical protein [Coriobacteriales bacterium]
LSTFEANYPLTTWLVEKKLISITTAYKPVLDAFDAGNFSGVATLSTQHFAYGVAEDLQLPYGANGIIDTAIVPAVEGVPVLADPIAQQIALRFDQKGSAGELPYFDVEAELTAQAVAEADEEVAEEASDEITGETPSGVTGETSDEVTGGLVTANPLIAAQVPASASYYALLLQEEGEGGEVMRAFAQDNGLSCLLLPLDVTGRYGVIALLSGAEKGVYGINLTGITPVPLAPTDPRGNAAFVKTP